MQREVDGVEGSGVETITWKHSDGRSEMATLKYGFVRTRDKAIVRSTREAKDGTVDQSVFGLNDLYAFKLRGSVHATQYSVDYLRPRNEKAEGFVRERVDRFLTAPWSVAARSLPDLMTSTEFRVREITPEVVGQRELARLSFDYERSVTSKETVLQSGRVLLDPNARWLVREYDVELTWGTLHGVIEYEPDFAGPLSMRSVRQRYHRTEGGLDTEVRFVFDSLVPASASDVSFTLTGFGLPELPLEVEQRTKPSGGKTIFAVAGLIGVAGVCLLVVAHRSRAAHI